MLASASGEGQPISVIEVLNPNNYVPTTEPDLHVFTHQEIQEIRDPLIRGETPYIANGYSFVFDRRPAGQEDEFIHATVFTAYFKRRLVPVADVGEHKPHDIDHSPGYTVIFNNATLADVIFFAANNTDGQLAKEEAFTDTIDDLGDTMTALTDPRLRNHDPAVFYINQQLNMAKESLRKLIDQALGETLEPDQKAEWIESLHQRIWEDTGLAIFETVSSELMETKYGKRAPKYTKAA
jgi:hypothetical protein